MATDYGNKLSSENSKTSLKFETKGKGNDDGLAILKTDYRSYNGKLTITTPTPSIWNNSTTIYKRSVSQSNPIKAAIIGFNDGEYTVEYAWNHNNPDPAYYTGDLTVNPVDANYIPVDGGTKNINANGITYHVPSNLTINRYSPVTLAGTIPSDSTSNIGGDVNDANLYNYKDSDITIYGPAQKPGSVNNLYGVLTLTSTSPWLTFNNGTTNEEYTFDNSNGRFPTITVNAAGNTPVAKYGTASAALDYSPKSSIGNSATTHTITLFGLKKLTDADNTQAITSERTATVNYKFHINNYQDKTADGVAIANLTPEDISNKTFTISQSGGNATVSNPNITYSLVFKSADYTVSGDNFTPTRTGDDTFNVNFGSIKGEEGKVSGSVSANFPDHFEVYGGTSNVTVNALTLTNPVDYANRNIKFTATGKIDFVDKVNNSTAGITDHTFQTSKEIVISQVGTTHNKPEAEIKWYIDPAKTNTAPYGKYAPTLSIGTNPISLGSSNKTISLTASSNESALKSGSITGDLSVSTNGQTSVPYTGGTVKITVDPKNMVFTNATIPATDSAYFRVRGYSTSNTKGIDNISTVAENSFGHDFSNTVPGSGKLVYNKLIYIKGQNEIENGTPSVNVAFTSTGGSTVSPSSLTFNSSASTRQTSWSIPGASMPSTSLTYEMAADNKSVTISMSGSNLSSAPFTCTYNYNGKSNSFSVTRQGNTQTIKTSLDVSGATNFLKTGNISFPMPHNALVGDTYSFSGWSFNSDIRKTQVNSLNWVPNTLEFSTTGEESSQIAFLNISTSPEPYTPKTIKFTLTGKKVYDDQSGINEYNKSWNVNVPVTTIGIGAPTISVSPAGYENYFSYIWYGPDRFAGTFKSVGVSGSALAINTVNYNTNGWDKYFTVDYRGASGGDSARTVTVVASCGGKSATLTCHRDAVSIPASSPTPITFNVLNNNPDFVTLSCPITSVNPNTTGNRIYPVATLKNLLSISLDKFDNYNSAFKGQGSTSILKTITTDITTTDGSGNPQLGAFDTGTYHFNFKYNRDDLNHTIILRKTATGKVVCNQDTGKSSNYSKDLYRNITVGAILENSRPNYAWSITNNSGAGFLTINNNEANAVLTLNNSNYRVSSESGVNETVTCTIKLNSPAKEYFGTDTIIATKTLHIDGKHYVNIPWSE